MAHAASCIFRPLWVQVPAAAELYAKASEILGYDLLEKCNGDKAELDSTVISQPAIFVSSLAAVQRHLPPIAYDCRIDRARDQFPFVQDWWKSVILEEEE